MDRKFGIAKQTIPIKNVWILVEGVPVEILHKEDNNVLVNSFHSASSDKACQKTISLEDYKKLIIETNVDEEGYIMGLYKYPKKIHYTEFDKRNKVKNLKKKIMDIIKKAFNDETFEKIKKKIEQLFSSQGQSPHTTIDTYKKFKSGELDTNTLQNVGDPIFDRSTHWTPPVNITHDEFKESPSYPAPIGIRPKDFALPSEVYDSIIELFKQIMTMKNVDREHFKNFCDEFEIELSPTNHKCKYCGKEIDINRVSSLYGSTKNYIEICHRDPEVSFTSENMYWGHGDCNRRQGGYSEIENIKDGITLLLIHEEHREKFRDILKQIVDM